LSERAEEYYCSKCRKYIKKEEAEIKYSQDFLQKRMLCPECFSRLITICRTCNIGKMKKSLIVICGDFTKDGFMESFCDECGAGFIMREPGKHFETFFISKRNIKNLVDKVFTIKGYPYPKKETAENIIFSHCKTRKEILDFFSDNLLKEKGFLKEELKGKYVNF